MTAFPDAGADGPVNQDAKQPGAERRAALEAADAPQDPDPGFLDHFLCYRAARHIAPGDGQHGVLVFPGQLGECALIAGAHPADQF